MSDAEAPIPAWPACFNKMRNRVQEKEHELSKQALAPKEKDETLLNALDDFLRTSKDCKAADAEKQANKDDKSLFDTGELTRLLVATEESDDVDDPALRLSDAQAGQMGNRMIVGFFFVLIVVAICFLVTKYILKLSWTIIAIVTALVFALGFIALLRTLRSGGVGSVGTAFSPVFRSHMLRGSGSYLITSVSDAAKSMVKPSGSHFIVRRSSSRV